MGRAVRKSVPRFPSAASVPCRAVPRQALIRVPFADRASGQTILSIASEKSAATRFTQRYIVRDIYNKHSIGFCCFCRVRWLDLCFPSRTFSEAFTRLNHIALAWLALVHAVVPTSARRVRTPCPISSGFDRRIFLESNTFSGDRSIFHSANGISAFPWRASRNSSGARSCFSDS